MPPRLILATLALLAAVPAALAQTKPETSGAQSFNEPEQRTRREGSYLPNQPGDPKVGRSGGSVAGPGRPAVQPR